MQKRAPEAAASTIRVRVVYARTNRGAEYGDPSMDKKSDLVILTATRADVAADADGWQAALRAGKPVRSRGVDVRDAIPNP